MISWRSARPRAKCLKKCERILMIFWRGGAWPKDQSFRFGDDLDSGFLFPPDQEFLKDSFFNLYYCDFYRQPRIKHENPRWRYAL